ncbi:MAG: protein-L-isoaspartate(D-aspartate) O-methyltransferase [Anaerolineales bacterium]
MALVWLAACVGSEPSPAALPRTAEGTGAPTEDPFREARERMVESGIVAWGIRDLAIVEVMGEVPRHEFVPGEYLGQAYENHPLPIGYGQTISQPYIVALMTEALDFVTGDKILEIGTGSGYQAAVLATLGAEVYTIEIIPALAREADERFDRLGFEEIQTRVGDGYFGWPEQAPFEGILVTAAPDHVPQPLLDQLVEGGVMVIPVGPVGGYQELWVVTRGPNDRYTSQSLGPVSFVPLTGEH